MTVSNLPSEFTEVSDGVTANYAFTFKMAEGDNLNLYYDGVLQVGGYTVTLNEGEGGNVNLSPVPAATTVIYGKRVTPPTQPLEIPRGQSFDEAKVEEMVDRVTMLVQESLRVAALALRIPDGEDNDVTASDAATRANKILAWDSAGELIESTLTLAELEEQPALAEAAQVAATAAAATATTKAAEAVLSAAAAQVAQLAAEAAASGMKWRPSVRAATTGTLPACTYANGSSGQGATLTGNANGALAAQDGVTLVAGEYLLVKDQASALQNGIYTVTQVGTAGTPFILTRNGDADTWAELVSQVRIADEGTTNADTIFICTVNTGGTIGTNNVTWTSISVTVPDGTLTYIKLASSAIAALSDLYAGTASKLVNAAVLFSAKPMLGQNYAHFQHSVSSGSNGGSSSATTYNTRTINTTVTNNITGCSLASNKITLPAGTYQIEANSVAFVVGATRLRWRNTTDGTTTLLGTSNDTGSSADHQSPVSVSGQFTIAGTKDFELQHYTQSARATNGLGDPVSSGENEIYADIRIWKIA